MMLTLFLLLCFQGVSFSSSTSYYAIHPPFQGPPYSGDINSYDPQSTAFEAYGNFTFHVDPDNTTDTFFFQPGPVAVLNDTDSTIITPLQCPAQITRLLLLKYNIQKKTYAQSSWILKAGLFYYLQYDLSRQRLIALRDNGTQTFVLEQYNTTTLDLVQEYTRQTLPQYGFPTISGPIFDPDENWIVELRSRADSGDDHTYYIKMDLNLVGKKDDIVTEYRRLTKMTALYSVTYDSKAKLALIVSERGIVTPEIIMYYMNPYTGVFQQAITLLNKPFGWVVQSFQGSFDESNRQVLFLIKITDLQQIRINVWSITVEFDTLKIIEKKQLNILTDLEQWSFFQIFNKQ